MNANAQSFSDHPRKILFRKFWARPILKFLHDQLNKKLVYLGLPGIKALDILEWKDYLRVVIAFQCENYDDRSSEDTLEQELNELLEILNKLESRQELEYYSLYIGYIERVIISGLDDKLNPFTQSDFITVYNLDFCNPLTSPFKATDVRGKIIKYYKLDAIEKLLSLEKERCNQETGTFFVNFITVNSVFWPDAMTEIDDLEIKSYTQNNLKGISGQKRDVRLLKAYAYYHIQKLYRQYGFYCEFLPVIYYKGSGGYKDNKNVYHDHWMLTFTVIGIPIETSAIPPFDQQTSKFLKEKFIFINDNSIKSFIEHKITEDDISTDVNEILKASLMNTSQTI